MAFSCKLLLQIAPSSLLPGVLDLLLAKYDFSNILDFCFNRIKSYFLRNNIAEVDRGTPPTHNIELFSQYLIIPLRAKTTLSILIKAHFDWWKALEKENYLLKHFGFLEHFFKSMCAKFYSARKYEAFFHNIWLFP